MWQALLVFSAAGLAAWIGHEAAKKKRDAEDADEAPTAPRPGEPGSKVQPGSPPLPDPGPAGEPKSEPDLIIPEEFPHRDEPQSDSLEPDWLAPGVHRVKNGHSYFLLMPRPTVGYQSEARSDGAFNAKLDPVNAPPSKEWRLDVERSDVGANVQVQFTGDGAVSTYVFQVVA